MRQHESINPKSSQAESAPLTMFLGDVYLQYILDKVYGLHYYPDFNVAETAGCAFRLHMFNFFHHNPNPSKNMLEKEIKKMEELSNIERSTKKEDNPLPTIGIEVEIPMDNNIQEIGAKILSNLHIPHEIEGDFIEVNPDYSYHALTQARLLQELTELGLIAGDIKNNTLSLHVNLGIPIELTPSIAKHWREIHRFNDLFTAAFTSPERLAQKKTASTLNLYKSAMRTNKDALINDRKLRLELRSFEFRDYPTYRMLVEVQRAGAALLSYLKRIEGCRVTEKENSLADMWVSFSKDFNACLDKYGYTLDMAADFDRREISTAIPVLRNTNVKKECRELITRFSLSLEKYLA